MLLPKRGGLTIQADNGRSPFVIGSLHVRGHASSLDPADERRLRISGLLIDGELGLEQALNFEFVHCTLVPREGKPGIDWLGRVAEVEALDLRVRIERSIIGPVRLPAQAVSLVCVDSVVGAGFTDSAPAICAEVSNTAERNVAFGPPTTLTCATVFGGVGSGNLAKRGIRSSAVRCRCSARNSVAWHSATFRLARRRRVGFAVSPTCPWRTETRVSCWSTFAPYSLRQPTLKPRMRNSDRPVRADLDRRRGRLRDGRFPRPGAARTHHQHPCGLARVPQRRAGRGGLLCHLSLVTPGATYGWDTACDWRFLALDL